MSTDGRDRMESIWAQIQNWMYNTEWTDANAADRVTQAVEDGGVDKFIDPLPGVPFPEAASGNYADIKQEFGLETKRDRDTARADFEDRQKAAAADEVGDQFREYGIQAVADAFDQRFRSGLTTCSLSSAPTSTGRSRSTRSGRWPISSTSTPS